MTQRKAPLADIIQTESLQQKDFIMAIASPDLRVDRIVEYLGEEADTLLNHRCETIAREDLALPGPDFAERVWLDSDRNPQVIRSLQQIYDNAAALAAAVMSRSCRSIKASSIQPAHPSRPTRLTSIPPRSSSWRWRAAATPSPQPSASSA